jgi:hypothetical protein
MLFIYATTVLLSTGKATAAELYFHHRGQLGSLPPLPSLQVPEHRPTPGILSEPPELHLQRRGAVALLSHR